MNLNELFRELEEELKRGNYTKEQKIGIINDVGNMYRNQTDKELNDYLTRQYLGTAFEIGSAAIPVGGISGQIAKKVVPAAITKTMGRKISQDVAAGAIGGAIDGAVFGVGRGLVEDENILKTAAQDGLLGLGIGSAFGGVTGKINKFNDAKSIKNLGEYGSLSKVGKKSYRDEINKYYSNYELGKNPNVSGIGTVKLSSSAMKETLRQKPELGKEVINLSDNLKKSVYKHPEVPEHSHKYNITEFHRVGNGNTDYLIAKNSKGDNYFHKAVTPDLIAGPKPEGQGLPINSISDSLPKFNLPDWTSSKLTPLMVSAIENNNIQKIPNNTSRTPDIARDYVRMTPPTYSGSALDFAGPKPAAHETLYNNSNKTLQKSQAAHVLRTSETVTSADRIPLQNLGINNNITDYMNKNNLPDWTIPNTSTGIVSAIDNYIKKY